MTMDSCFCAGKLAVGVFLLVFGWEMTGSCGEVVVSLEMPRYAVRGSSVALHCEHNVQPDLLYKVEWLREGAKIFQYVRERRPPFRNYTTTGAQLDMSQSNESTIILQDLEFAASGIYYCEVSLETPIYTKASTDKELLIIQPQRHPPRITFGAPLYTAGELVEANCTSSPAHPAPHITWFINGIKVDPALSRSYTRLAPLYRGRKRHRSARSRQHPTVRPLHPTVRPLQRTASPNDVGVPAQFDSNGTKVGKSCSAREVYGGVDHYHRHSARDTPQVGDETTLSHPSPHHRPGHLVLGGAPRPPGQRLSVAVSALRLAAGGRLALTCLATIPAYRGPAGIYADSRNHTVIVDVVVAEELEPEPTQPIMNMSNIGIKIGVDTLICIYVIIIIISINTIW